MRNMEITAEDGYLKYKRTIALVIGKGSFYEKTNRELYDETMKKVSLMIAEDFDLYDEILVEQAATYAANEEVSCGCSCEDSFKEEYNNIVNSPEFAEFIKLAEQLYSLDKDFAIKSFGEVFLPSDEQGFADTVAEYIIQHSLDGDTEALERLLENTIETLTSRVLKLWE